MIPSRFREVIVIHQQLVPFRPIHFQAHLVLETVGNTPPGSGSSCIGQLCRSKRVVL